MAILNDKMTSGNAKSPFVVSTFKEMTKLVTGRHFKVEREKNTPRNKKNTIVFWRKLKNKEKTMQKKKLIAKRLQRTLPYDRKETNINEESSSSRLSYRFRSTSAITQDSRIAVDCWLNCWSSTQYNRAKETHSKKRISSRKSANSWEKKGKKFRKKISTRLRRNHSYRQQEVNIFEEKTIHSSN